MDLTEAQWKKLKPLLAPRRHPRRSRSALARYASRAERRSVGLAHRRSLARSARPLSFLPNLPSAFSAVAARWHAGPDCLHALAEDLRARGKLDLSETFIDASFSSAKKGALLSARLAEEKVVKSWRSQTAMVFLSPAASPALRLMKANSSKPPSRSASREPNQNE